MLRALADGFEVRLTSALDAVSATDWLQDEVRSQAQAASVRDLSVREIDDIVVVNFLLDRRRPVHKKTVVSTHYVIDIWRQSTHQLIARYVSQPTHPVPIPSRPTGSNGTVNRLRDYP